MARSPNYPRLSFREALEYVETIYEAESLQSVKKDDVARDLGYKSVNGASLGIINALRKYGLLRDESDNNVRVSDEALNILRPKSEAQRAGYIKRLAFAPKPLDDLYELTDDRLPEEDYIRDVLASRGFLEKAISEVIRIYYDNIELVFGNHAPKPEDFVPRNSAQYTTVDEPTNKQHMEAGVQSQQKSTNGVSASRAPDEARTSVPTEQGALKEVLRVFPRGREVRLYMDGKVTWEAIDRLIAYLELAREDWPKEDQATDGQREQSNERFAFEAKPE